MKKKIIKVGILLGWVLVVFGTAALVWSQSGSSNPWERDTAWQAPTDFKYGGVFAELNGDGLPDILFARDARGAGTGALLRASYINNGKKGWIEDNRWIPPPGIDFFTSGSSQPSGSTIVDLNGDGLTDIVRAWTDGRNSIRAVYINTGTGWEEQTEKWSGWYGSIVGNGGRDGGLRFQDLNGDGLVDAINSHRQPSEPDVIDTWVYINKGN